MKRFLLIASAAALLMTSCSEEKFLNISGVEEATNKAPGTIEFQANQPNQSRANLEEFATSFGVFGIKANVIDGVPQMPTFPIKHSSTHGQLVFNNYLVGHTSAYPILEGGVTETNTPGNTGWYYEGLGYDEYPEVTGAFQSAWDKQYLKYWDGSYKYTYFIAYTPYDNTTDEAKEPTILKSSQGNNYLCQLKVQNPIEVNAVAPLMVAAQREENSAHITAGNTKKVPLLFNHFQSQIRIAFYEVIKGYKVKMINVKGKSGTYGAIAVPFKNVTYDPGTIKYSREVAIEIKKDADDNGHLPIEFIYEDDEAAKAAGDKPFVFDFDIENLYSGSPKGTYEECLQEERAKKVFSPTVYNVFPRLKADEPNPDPLQFVLAFQLIAEDTGEVINVTDARVDIPADYVKWNKDCVYTYVFKITKNTNGVTSIQPDDYEPTTPEKPKGTPALYPIVFDQLTVQDLTADGNTKEFTLYDANDNPTATEDGNGKFIFKSETGVTANKEPKDFAEVGLYQSINLKDYMVDAYANSLTTEPTCFNFTADQVNGTDIVQITDGVVTGLALGCTTIHVVYTKTIIDSEGSRTVTVKDALIVYVVNRPQYLKEAIVVFGVNTPTDLSSLLKDSSNWNKITWTINGTELRNSPISNSVFTYAPSDKKITFKNLSQTYLCSAVYDDGTNQHTDYFFVLVKNDFLKMETMDCTTGTDYVLTEFLKDSSKASYVTWTLDTTSLNTDLMETNFDYDSVTKALQFKVAGTYTLTAVYTYGGEDKEENIILTVTAPTPANP